MRIGSTNLVVVGGSVLDQDADAIVNAANTFMRGGGGVDGAIHDAAGPGLLEELQRVAPNGAETGTVVVTSGHDLPHRFIFHTPGPRWSGGDRGEPKLLASCYSTCLERGSSLGIARLAFCSISTGIYGYPLAAAAEVALRTTREYLQANPETSLRFVIFAMFGQQEHAVFHAALARLSSP